MLNIYILMVYILDLYFYYVPGKIYVNIVSYEIELKVLFAENK